MEHNTARQLASAQRAQMLQQALRLTQNARRCILLKHVQKRRQRMRAAIAGHDAGGGWTCLGRHVSPVAGEMAQKIPSGANAGNLQEFLLQLWEIGCFQRLGDIHIGITRPRQDRIEILNYDGLL